MHDEAGATLTVHIPAAAGEHEAKAISKRNRAMLAQAKTRGVKLGGKRGHMLGIAAQGHAASLAVRQGKAKSRAADLLPAIAEVHSGSATSLQAVADALNNRDIPTARCGRWSAVQA